MAERIACGDVVQGCQFSAEADTEEELLRAVQAHAAADHGVKELTPELAAAREDVRRQFEQTRTIVEPLQDAKKTPVLPLPANSTVLPQLFTLQQQLESLSKPAGAFDPEIAYQLNQASKHAAELVDLLASANDRPAVVKKADQVLDCVGGAVALLGHQAAAFGCSKLIRAPVCFASSAKKAATGWSLILPRVKRPKSPKKNESAATT